MRLAGPGHA
ncbi:hypothetical protein SM139_2570, partial [Stenotrophomonas maltophilia]